jgi:hypothetical protein
MPSVEWVEMRYSLPLLVNEVILFLFLECFFTFWNFGCPIAVIAIDIDPVKIEYAKRNAAIYGVLDRIEFIVGDFFQVAPMLVADVVFLSPPWGGLGYVEHEAYDLEKMELNGFKVFEAACGISRNIAFFLPRNVAIEQVRTWNFFFFLGFLFIFYSCRRWLDPGEKWKWSRTFSIRNSRRL